MPLFCFSFVETRGVRGLLQGTDFKFVLPLSIFLLRQNIDAIFISRQNPRHE